MYLVQKVWFHFRRRIGCKKTQPKTTSEKHKKDPNIEKTICKGPFRDKYCITFLLLVFKQKDYFFPSDR